MSAAPDATKRKPTESAHPEPPSKVCLKLSTDKSSGKPTVTPIKLNLPQPPKRSEPSVELNSKVKAVFNPDEESEEEEIPEEARIRMRNLGKYTPTSCGPNSYGKSKYGFIDRRALLDRQTEALNEIVSDDNR